MSVNVTDSPITGVPGAFARRPSTKSVVPVPVVPRKTAFALLASMALKHKESTDADYLRCLPLIEKAAADERNFVKKAVSWALRGVGRRSALLHKASLALAKELAASKEPAPRWIGKNAFRELSGAATKGRSVASCTGVSMAKPSASEAMVRAPTHECRR